MAQSPANHRTSAMPSTRSQTRSACNRCHQQKLRCIKTKEQASCERCVRLKTECRYRPRGRRNDRNGPSNPGVELRNLAPTVAPAIPDMADVSKEIGYDWLSFLNTETNSVEEIGYLDSDLRFPLRTSPGGTPAGSCQSSQPTEPLNIHALEHHTREAFDIIPVHQDTIGAVGSDHPYELHSNPSRGLERPLTSIVGRLTNLSMALYECASKLPSIKVFHTESAGLVNVPYAMSSNRREGALLALDEVFRVTNEFINVMRNPYSTADYPDTPTLTSASMTSTSQSTQIRSTVNPLCVVPQMLSDQRGFTTQPANVGTPHEPGTSSPMQQFPHLDEATMLLFLSCHCRLVEIYSSVFQEMRRCLEGSNTTPHSRAGVILPQLQVGGFGGISSPALRVDFNGPLLPPATISMYMTLITTLSSQLWAQVADALRKGKSYDISSSQPPVHYFGMESPTLVLAMERTDNMKRTIELVKGML